jgi:hypothetical protein
VGGRDTLDLQSGTIAPWRPEVVAAIDATQRSSPPCHRAAIGIFGSIGDLGDERSILLGAGVTHLMSRH